MTHLLLITQHNGIPEDLQTICGVPELRVVQRKRPDEIRAALERGVFDSALIYADTSREVWSKMITELRAIQPGLLILAVLPGSAAEPSEKECDNGNKHGKEDKNEDGNQEEDTALNAGADLCFTPPLPARSLARLIHYHESAPEDPVSGGVNSGKTGFFDSGAAAKPSALQIVRDFSHILGFSLDHKAFSQHFILKLREHIRFSRIAIFLETSSKQSIIGEETSNELPCIASLGLPSDLVECFQLGRDTGIAKTLRENPRILDLKRVDREGVPPVTPAVRKEFRILGCHLALPVSDRERVIGVAVLSGPVTERNFLDDELELLYLLMEELGLAVRNSKLHCELAARRQLIEDVLKSMLSGAIVLNEHLKVLYANRAARKFLRFDPKDPAPVEWGHLPGSLATPVHRAVEKGELPEPFLIPGPREGETYRVSIIPFSQEEELSLLPRPVMVILEDFTKIEAGIENAVADSRSELIRLISERFAHEIRNSLVPLNTHAQLIEKKIDQPKFQASLKNALQNETARIKRFSEQMLYLAQSSVPDEKEEAEITDLVKESFERARKQLPEESVQFEVRNEAASTRIQSNSEALGFAFEEIFLNAIQAQKGRGGGHILVQLDANPEECLRLRIRDEGPGFSAEIIDKATEPFQTSKNTGVGLGLAIAEKIISEHRGSLRLNAKTPEADWDIEISLPNVTTPIHP